MGRLGGEEESSSYSFLTSALDGVSGQRHAPAALYPRGMDPGTHCTDGWVGPRAGLDAETRRKILCLCRGSNPGRPVCSQALYWLSYPGSSENGSMELLTVRPLRLAFVLNGLWTRLCANVRGGAFMLTVLARLTHWKPKNKKSSVLLSWFSGTPYTECSRTDQIKCIFSQLQPDWCC
jgi:hypothetical protein